MNDDDAPARPEPFSAYTTPEFWDDAHISQRMLDHHLDPTLDLGDGYDAALLIYEDYCAMSPAQRALLLARVREALRPGGHVLFDVTSAARCRQPYFRRTCQPVRATCTMSGDSSNAQWRGYR